MEPGLGSNFKEQVRAQTDLVSLVSENVRLQSSGREFVGLCPFHDDHNPSMRVYPDRQTWRCWVCNEGGDCFSWVQLFDKIGFREALELLAKRAHLELPKQYRSGGDQAGRSKERIYEALAWAELQFHQCLKQASEAKAARDYLAERGFTAETIDRFRLGYHPANWEWLSERSRGQYRPEELAAAQLVRQRDRGNGYYDYFVDRVMFPIHDERARPVAFGGRVLPGAGKDAAKYWNSPESTVFSKSRLLYGLHQARDAIRKTGVAVVVEGYTDCIASQQAGLANVVGTLGTALTETHVTRLKHFARKVVLLYDGDDAGKMAAERALSRFLAQEVDLRILTLPDGKDPADWIASAGIAELEDRIGAAPEAWEHKLNLVVGRYGLDSIDAKHRVLNEMLELAATIPRLAGTIREEIILAKTSQILGLPESSVRRSLADIRKHRAAGPHGDGPRQVTTARQAATAQTAKGESAAPSRPSWNYERPSRDDALEADLLEIVFASPQVVSVIREQIPLKEIRNEQLRELLAICYALANQGVTPTVETVTAELEDHELRRLAFWLDQASRQKDVAGLLQDTMSRERLPNGPKSFLEQAIHNILWRTETADQPRLRGLIAYAAHSETPGDAAKRLMRRASQFHQKRAT